MWAGVCEWDLETSTREFPYETRVPGRGVETVTEENLWDIIATLDVPGVEAFFVADANKLVTKWAIGVVSRYTFCSEFNCPAFSGSFDDQPAWWVSAVHVIKEARIQASEWRRNGTKKS